MTISEGRAQEIFKDVLEALEPVSRARPQLRQLSDTRWLCLELEPKAFETGFKWTIETTHIHISLEHGRSRQANDDVPLNTRSIESILPHFLDRLAQAQFCYKLEGGG